MLGRVYKKEAHVKPPVLGFVAAVALTSVLFPAIGLAQAQPPDNSDAPLIPFVSVPNYLKYSPDMNLGEILGVAENSKGHLVVLNHPG